MTQQQAEPQILRWTRSDSYRMNGAGLFSGSRVELVATQATLSTADAITPLALPGVSIPVADMLP
jgi:hypothetical protein